MFAASSMIMQPATIRPSAIRTVLTAFLRDSSTAAGRLITP